MPIQIENDVPLPIRMRNRVRVGRLPLAELHPGDSFLIEIGPEETDRALHSIRVRLTRYGSLNPGKKFSSTKDESGKGIRVWRTV